MARHYFVWPLLRRIDIHQDVILTRDARNLAIRPHLSLGLFLPDAKWICSYMTLRDGRRTAVHLRDLAVRVGSVLAATIRGLNKLEDYMNQATVNTLWTSGWDSTYRIADLVLNQRIPVRPWYVMDENRRSTSVELRTLAKLRELILSKDANAEDLLKPMVVRRRKDIPEAASITKRYDSLFERGYLGRQYEWLARLASSEDVELELGLKADDRPSKMLMPYIVPVDGPGQYALARGVSDEPLRLFDRFFFPILDLTKADMMANASEMGFLDVLNQTWFCHCPTFSGKACGWCAPCEHARDEGFGWRVPKATTGRRLEFLAQKVIWKARLAVAG